MNNADWTDGQWFPETASPATVSVQRGERQDSVLGSRCSNACQMLSFPLFSAEITTTSPGCQVVKSTVRMGSPQPTTEVRARADFKDPTDSVRDRAEQSRQRGGGREREGGYFGQNAVAVPS